MKRNGFLTPIIRRAMIGFICACFMCSLGLSPAAHAEEQFAGTIIIGDDDEFTGAYSATTFVMTQAAQDYWKQHNNQIEVDGKKYKIVHNIIDNKSDVSLSVSNFHRFSDEGALVIRTNWTPGMVAMKSLAEKDKIPVFGGGGNQSVFDPPATICMVPSQVIRDCCALRSSGTKSTCGRVPAR